MKQKRESQSWTMVKRSKRLERGIESLKKEIEEQFSKLDEDLIEEDEILAKYHIKEIDKSFIVALEHKMDLINQNNENIELIKEYKNRLGNYKKKFGIK